ncbi:sulfotransferase [Nocardioides sp. zg-578]|uniref:Sulfotransferase n=2 Tax=Nocardioides marmotae TaxID=2663857 RepID=A0A6I3JEE1_9ACTN|nr:sulfotransferase [Nocardioides marmotae]MCR6032924.1 sulfotransferase [Gordonia jinghuaiqii]MTB84560.1 sulfotransferase [Nocardioides marmotae]MTB96574.1 sulfotransferase [Nocardioides marmotae]QKE03548.1 sulfotransferase [Nocardioides marmotae]
MVPDIIVVGAQRAGTTTMFRLLSEHPDLVRPTATKGTSYFDDEYHRGPRWYRAHFPLGPLARLARPGRRLRTFECGGYYLFHPLAADRIARDLPGAHVVVLVRDPVERARSAHRHELARGFESLPFDAALRAEERRLAGEQERLATEPRSTSFEHRHHAYLGRGRYGEQVERFVSALGPDRVHVVDADRFFADPVPQFAALQRRLGLSTWVPAAVERWNARPADPLPPDEHADLLTHFADSDAQLARHLDQAPSWRAEAVAR